MNRESYTAASTFPSKLLHQKVVDKGKIIPIHAQLITNNDCNLNCKFCSYGDRNKNIKLDYNEVKKIINVLANKGTKALTYTGGGEPCLYPFFNEVIDYAHSKGIKVALVSNGIALDKLKYHPNLTWCRISSSDDRTPAYKTIEGALEVNPQTDWAFSHVVTSFYKKQIINGIIDFANKNNFTHVRLVSDLCNLDNVPSMEEVKNEIYVNDSKVIYQGRKDSTRGDKNCLISLLKPVIGPEGIFPCCGTNYAIKGMERRPVDEMKMGDIKDLADILDNQKHFDGSICDVCYYSEYNSALKKLLNKPEHLKFV